jgi:hypothetical protein
MSKKDLSKEFLGNISASAAKCTMKYLDSLIGEFHKDLEVAKEEEFPTIQGEIRAYRSLKKTLKQKIA